MGDSPESLEMPVVKLSLKGRPLRRSRRFCDCENTSYDKTEPPTKRRKIQTPDSMLECIPTTETCLENSSPLETRCSMKSVDSSSSESVMLINQSDTDLMGLTDGEEITPLTGNSRCENADMQYKRAFKDSSKKLSPSSLTASERTNTVIPGSRLSHSRDESVNTFVQKQSPMILTVTAQIQSASPSGSYRVDIRDLNEHHRIDRGTNTQYEHYSVGPDMNVQDSHPIPAPTSTSVVERIVPIEMCSDFDCSASEQQKEENQTGSQDATQSDSARYSQMPHCKTQKRHQIARMQLLQNLLCPVCRTLYVAAVTCQCGHTCCFRCLQTDGYGAPCCPICEEPNLAIVPGHTIDACVNALVTSCGNGKDLENRSRFIQNRDVFIKIAECSNQRKPNSFFTPVAHNTRQAKRKDEVCDQTKSVTTQCEMLEPLTELIEQELSKVEGRRHPANHCRKELETILQWTASMLEQRDVSDEIIYFYRENCDLYPVSMSSLLYQKMHRQDSMIKLLVRIHLQRVQRQVKNLLQNESLEKNCDLWCKQGLDAQIWAGCSALKTLYYVCFGRI